MPYSLGISSCSEDCSIVPRPCCKCTLCIMCNHVPLVAGFVTYLSFCVCRHIYIHSLIFPKGCSHRLMNSSSITSTCSPIVRIKLKHTWLYYIHDPALVLVHFVVAQISHYSNILHRKTRVAQELFPLFFIRSYSRFSISYMHS